MREGGRDVCGEPEEARDGEPDDGNQDFKLFKMVDLDDKRGNFFFWPDMLLVASKQCSAGYSRSWVEPKAVVAQSEKSVIYCKDSRFFICLAAT